MGSTTAQAGAADLAMRLRDGTRELHRAAERSAFMRRLLAGEVDLAGYVRLLRNLHALYERLEAALARHAAVGPLRLVHEPALWRSAALEADLAVLHGGAWRQSIPLTAAAAAYVGRLDGLDASDPALLLAHSYVRYLGDLSGGQVLRGVVADAYGLRDGAGTRFYAFGPPGAGVLAARYRQGLAAMRLDDDLAARVLEEARDAFRRHGALFAQLG